MTKEAILNGKLKRDGDSGDGKRVFIVASTNDGYRDLRIEVDTDDCDSSFANQWITRLIGVMNACKGMELAELKWRFKFSKPDLDHLEAVMKRDGLG